MSDENDETTSAEPTETDAQSIESGSTESGTNTSETTDESFDAASVEQAFGLPAGALNDCKDTASALLVVRDFTDKTLIAGLGHSVPAIEDEEEPASPAAKGAKKPDTKGKTAESTGNEEVEALRARLAKVEGLLEENAQNYNAQLAQQLNQRIDSEIDTWKSTKYGTSKSRTYKQMLAYNEVRGLLKTHVAGLQVSGQPVSQVEMLLRRVRAFDDDTYVPAKQKPNAEKLGTPGGRKGNVGGDKTPRNIHEALMQNWG